MSFHNEEEDDELLRAIQASIEEISNHMSESSGSSSGSSSLSTNNDITSEDTNEDTDNLDFERDIETITDDEKDETEDETDETEDELENIHQLNPEHMNNDDDLTIALQASLVDYHKTEKEILSEIQEKSLQTIEDDKKRKLQKEQDLKKEDDEIMEKILQESYESNIALQTQSNTSIINNSTINNEFDIDEEQYMNMILQQIKEEEVREKRMKELNTQTQELQQSRTLKEEQDLEYEESLRIDIAKEQEKKGESKSESKPIENKPVEKPLTKEEIRQARLAFLNKK